MLSFISWFILMVGILFLFEIPQKVYYAVKKRDDKLKEVKTNGRNCCINRDDDRS